MGDCGERPCRGCIDEQPRSIDEISGDGTSRINAAPGPVYVDDTNGDVANLVMESPKSEGQLARRMFAQSLGRLNVTGANQKIDWNVHEHLLCTHVVLRSRPWSWRVGLLPCANKPTFGCLPQDATSNQLVEHCLTRVPVGGPQSLCLRQRHAQAWHFHVLRFDSAREPADGLAICGPFEGRVCRLLSLIHISEPTRLLSISY